MGRHSPSQGVILCHIQPRSVIMSIRNHAFRHLADDTLETCAGDHASHPTRVPGPAAAAKNATARSSRVMTGPAHTRHGQRRRTSGRGPVPQPPGSAALHRLPLARSHRGVVAAAPQPAGTHPPAPRSPSPARPSRTAASRCPRTPGSAPGTPGTRGAAGAAGHPAQTTPALTGVRAVAQPQLSAGNLGTSLK